MPSLPDAPESLPHQCSAGVARNRPPTRDVQLCPVVTPPFPFQSALLRRQAWDRSSVILPTGGDLPEDQFLRQIQVLDIVGGRTPQQDYR
jgi:hypothetical protein